MTALIFTVAALVALYAVWRVRFRYPPDDLPRVLCFHKVSRRFCFEGTWTTPRRFAATVDRLIAEGYRFLTEAEYLECLDHPDPSCQRSVFLTFDDAYENVYRDAFPLLRERGIPFHLFVVSDFAGRPNTWDLSLGRPPHRHAGWEQLSEMVAAGATVGSHTATHADLTRLDGPAVEDELRRSRDAIAARLGRAPRTFSYPFGRFDRRAQDTARRVGYEAAFSLYPPGSNARVDRYALRRNGVYIIDTAAWVERKLQRNSWFWFEEMKCRAINGVAVLTPLFKRPATPADRGS
jgi:peptidoglycan/xylan/chitin deacetylase (PgdA/CDA1 family)